MSSVLCRWTVLVVAVFVGCESRGPGEAVIPPTPAELARMALEEIATRGAVNGSLEQVREQAERLQATDPGKARTLQADCNRLKSLSDPGAIRAKAEEMAGRL